MATAVAVCRTCIVSVETVFAAGKEHPLAAKAAKGC